ncbi:MAG: ABC transporter ATP-binding protein [Lachnospiraceae bacterium]|jgi:ABC-type multidrug transport system fused ATPase/permease subunit|nr:ABC transporter ATP-binding protein [Lachnospiraceae bacterium]
MRNFIAIHKTGFRLLKRIHSVDSVIIPIHLLKVFFSLVRVYAGLFLTAEMIDSLLGGNYRQAAEMALALLLAELAAGAAISAIKSKTKGYDHKIWLVFYVWLREKAFSMDYETMENPEVAEKILYSERTADMYGSLGVLLYHYCNILEAMLNVLFASFLVIGLCLSKPVQTGGWMEKAASPIFSLLLFLGVMAGMALCCARVFEKFAAKQMELFGSHTGVENKLSCLLGQIYENPRAAKIVRIYDMAQMILENTAGFIEKSLAFFRSMYDVQRKEGDANKVVGSVFTVCAYLLVAVKTVTGAITVGAFTRYAGAMNQFGNACFSIIESHGRLREICTYMQEFLAFLDTENLHAKGSIPVEKRTDGAYELAFEHVSFHYPGSDVMVLRDVNCKLNIRGKLAVVGRNGAGKTTFIKLLCRLYEPTQGRITLNGVDIRKYDEEEYRSLFGVVFQDFKLFAFPLWENVTAGYPRCEERIWEALRRADADRMVEGMEEKLDTWLYKDYEDGVEISGGEAQKLALARALYKDAPVVVLDEPTAALDPKAEAEIYARFNEMVEGRTSIYISHRMSSCRFCDDIIVFEDGRIAERGSHEELTAARGSYARMWEAQAKYYA